MSRRFILSSIGNSSSYGTLLASQLFAPSEDAFAGLSVEDLCAEKALLTEILTYHVIPTVLPSPHIPSGTTYVKTIQGSFLTLHSTDLGTDEAVLKVNDATVISADVGTNNGMIHVIDGVLEPPMGHKGECGCDGGVMQIMYVIND